MTDFLSPKTFNPSQNAQLFCEQNTVRKRPLFWDRTLQTVQSFVNCTTFKPKMIPKISCDIRNSIQISQIMGSTVHMIHFEKLKIVTKKLDFARYDPFMIFGTAVIFVIWGARLILVCKKLKSETPFLAAELHPIAMATGIQKSESR